METIAFNRISLENGKLYNYQKLHIKEQFTICQKSTENFFRQVWNPEAMHLLSKTRHFKADDTFQEIRQTSLEKKKKIRYLIA